MTEPTPGALRAAYRLVPSWYPNRAVLVTAYAEIISAETAMDAPLLETSARALLDDASSLLDALDHKCEQYIIDNDVQRLRAAIAQVSR